MRNVSNFILCLWAILTFNPNADFLGISSKKYEQKIVFKV